MLNKTLIILFLGLFLGACASKEQAVRANGGASRISQNHLSHISTLDAELKKSTTTDETRSKLLATKGRLYLELGRYDEAIQSLELALQSKVAPANPSELHMNLGKAYIGKNEYAKAIQFLNQAERSDKNFNPEERKKLVVQSLVAEKEFYPALAALSKSYHKGNQKKDNFYYETAAKTYLKMGFEYKNLGFYKKSYQVALLGLQEYPENEILRSIQKDCLEVLQPEGKL